MDKVAARIAETAQFLAAVMLALIAAVNIVNVVGRYVFSKPIEPAEEWMLFLLAGAVFLSFVKVTYEGAHIRMDALHRALPAPLQRPLELLGDAVSVALSVTMVWVGAPIVMQLASYGQKSDFGFPMAIPQSVIPIGFALAALVLTVRIFTRRPPPKAQD
jgi:TRAP-type C4-dicarboxylate transport system permease small subunit